MARAALSAPGPCSPPGRTASIAATLVASSPSACASEILGYLHPDDNIRMFWNTVYLMIVNDAHLAPEPFERMMKRLGDSETDWRAAEVVTAKSPQ